VTIRRRAGVSGRSTVWFSLVKPTLRTISFCVFGKPMALR